MSEAAPARAPDGAAGFAAVSFACSAWAALGTYPFIESAVARAMVFWSAPALALGALLLASLGLRPRPLVSALGGLIALGAAYFWAVVFSG